MAWSKKFSKAMPRMIGELLSGFFMVEKAAADAVATAEDNAAALAVDISLPTRLDDCN